MVTGATPLEISYICTQRGTMRNFENDYRYENSWKLALEVASDERGAHWHHPVITTVTYYIWVFITNKGAQCEISKTSTDMRTAVMILYHYIGVGNP